METNKNIINDQNKDKLDDMENEVVESINKENCQANCSFKEDEENSKELSKLAMGKYYLQNLQYQAKTKKEKFKHLFKNYWKKILVVFFAALLFNFAINTFINRAETIPSGLTGLPIIIVLIFPQVKPYFALIYLAANIPLFLTFGLKAKKSFIFLTLAFMIFQIPTNFFFTWEPVNNALFTWFNLAPNWTQSVVVKELAPGLISNESFKVGQVIDNPVSWPILVNGIVGSLLIAMSISLTWKSGGSTGGTDIVAYYFATKSKKNVAGVLTIISIAISLFFMIIFIFAKPHSLVPIDYEIIGRSNQFPYYHEIKVLKIDWNGKPLHRDIFGMRELSTLLYIVINNTILALVYPKYKKVKLSISCNNPDAILKYFKQINFWHSYTLRKVKSGYTGNTIVIIESVMLLLETKNLVSDIKIIEPNAWISITPVKWAIGKFNTKYVE